jgi:hypothetical protein
VTFCILEILGEAGNEVSGRTLASHIGGPGFSPKYLKKKKKKKKKRKFLGGENHLSSCYLLV